LLSGVKRFEGNKNNFRIHQNDSPGAMYASVEDMKTDKSFDNVVVQKYDQSNP